jgi:hypothetical protein
MPKHLFEQPQITLNGYDVAADVHQLELMTGRRSPVDVTGLSDTHDQFLVPFLRRAAVRMSFFNNFDASSSGSSIVAGINVALNSLLNSSGTSGVAFVLRSSTGARSASNPEWQGSVQIDGDFVQTGGDVAEADRGTVALKVLGQLSRLTSST